MKTTKDEKGKENIHFSAKRTAYSCLHNTGYRRKEKLIVARGKQDGKPRVVRSFRCVSINMGVWKE